MELTLENYKEFVLALIKPGEDIEKEVTEKEWDLWKNALNISREANALYEWSPMLGWEWSTSEHANIYHLITGIISEVGELLDAIKKIIIYRKEPDIKNIIEEIGDLEFFMTGLGAIFEENHYISRIITQIRNLLVKIIDYFNLTREQCILANMEKLSKRYHTLTYSNTHAIERKDKE